MTDSGLEARHAHVPRRLVADVVVRLRHCDARHEEERAGHERDEQHPQRVSPLRRGERSRLAAESLRGREKDADGEEGALVDEGVDAGEVAEEEKRLEVPRHLEEVVDALAPPLRVLLRSRLAPVHHRLRAVRAELPPEEGEQAAAAGPAPLVHHGSGEPHVGGAGRGGRDRAARLWDRAAQAWRPLGPLQERRPVGRARGRARTAAFRQRYCPLLPAGTGAAGRAARRELFVGAPAGRRLGGDAAAGR
mmetsp:Transcript_41518/g.133511  ORF Transcript_41518/g.133511 Transcript_41518/m.133511 type:complete len:249 (-) Transcript_41518:154-900(-)